MSASLGEPLTIGVSDHGGWAALVTVARNGRLVGRHRVELVDAGLPKIPYHCEAQQLPMEEAVALVERVRLSAERQSRLVLESVARMEPGRIVGIALRACPELPSSITERIEGYRSRNVADWVMYRKALAAAAEERGWAVCWYEAKHVLAEAAEAMQIQDFEAHFQLLKKSCGPPWGKDQKVAMAAAIAMASRMS